MALGCRRQKLTKDGIELTWAVNHLAPFLLSKLLLHRLKESAPARIITTASQAHRGARIPFDDLNAERSYRGFGRYCETKLANILFTTGATSRWDWGDGELLPPRARGNRIQSQQRPADGLGYDDPQAGVTQPREGR
jgi:NAD(P)-dependent dehydrogenase (short-subunit alcohol dehydrogenase family)